MAGDEPGGPLPRRPVETVGWAAIEAALLLPWSQGQTEGQVTRLKRVQRAMFGRGVILRTGTYHGFAAAPYCHPPAVLA
jgi:hypothetical protein